MSGRKKRKASSITLGPAQTGSSARKSARLTLPLSLQKDTTHGVEDRFPWARLPSDMQERIMAMLRVRDTARLTSAIKSRDALAIHREMMQKRHDALREVVRDRFGDEAARLMPPLHLANPGDLYVEPQVPPLLQLRPHRKNYRRGTVTELRASASGHKRYKLEGWCQGYLTRAGLEGWGRWDGSTTWNGTKARESFVGEWRAGKRYFGTHTSHMGQVSIGGYKNDLRHGPAVSISPCLEGSVYDCVFENGKMLTYRKRDIQPLPTLAMWMSQAWARSAGRPGC